MDFNRILVPLDFSECSKNALKSAISLARKGNSEIILMHAYHVPVPHVEAGASAMVQPLMEGYEQNVESDFQSLKEEIPALGEFKTVEIIVHGFATDAIYSTIESHQIDIVVMGTKGASGILEKLLGSITAQVIREAPCPVLAIPEQATMDSVQKIAMALDLKPVSSENAYKPLVGLARLFGAELHLLNIVGKDEEVSQEMPALEHFDYPDIKPCYDCVSNKDVEKGILNYVENHQVDIVGILPRHHGIIENLFTTSTTDQLAFHSKVPILAIHEH